MIVEINERQTGKTTRLIEHAYNFLMSCPKRICIVSYNLKNSKRIKNELLFKYKSKFNNDKIRQFERRIHYCSNMHTIGVDYDFYYVDEFVHMKHKDLLILNNAYYTSSLYEKIVNYDTIEREYFLPKNPNEVLKALLNYDMLKRRWMIEKLYDTDDSKLELSEYIVKQHKIKNNTNKKNKRIYE